MHRQAGEGFIGTFAALTDISSAGKTDMLKGGKTTKVHQRITDEPADRCRLPDAQAGGEGLLFGRYRRLVWAYCMRFFLTE